MYHAPLVLITGPSGSGKDSLITGLRHRVAGDDRFVFTRRYITRPADAGGEAHYSVTPAEFEQMRTAGRFALSWNAYGRSYGIGREVADELAAGRCVIANVSRTIIADARRLFSPVLVISLAVPAPVLAMRLNLRGREPSDEMEARLRRSTLAPPHGPDVVTLCNDRPLDHCVNDLLRLLLAQSPWGSVAAD